jgi:hypothetical protein
MAGERERERTQGGEFTEETTLGEVLDMFERVTFPSMMTGEVADDLGISSESARQKLLALSDQGRVATRKAGRTRLWWRTDDASEDPESERLPAITDCSHDFYSGDSQVLFSNGVTLGVTSDEAGTSFELTHPDKAAETWTDSIERRPAEILLEILDDYYNASGEDRAVTVPDLDAYMQEVDDDE